MELIVDKSRKFYVEFPPDRSQRKEQPIFVPKPPKNVREHTFKNWNDKYEIQLRDITSDFVEQLDEFFVPNHYIVYWNDAIARGLHKIIYDNSSSRWKCC
jgi:hypothetical protein